MQVTGYLISFHHKSIVSIGTVDLHQPHIRHVRRHMPLLLYRTKNITGYADQQRTLTNTPQNSLHITPPPTC